MYNYYKKELSELKLYNDDLLDEINVKNNEIIKNKKLYKDNKNLLKKIKNE